MDQGTAGQFYAVDMKFSSLDYAPWKTLADRALARGRLSRRRRKVRMPQELGTIRKIRCLRRCACEAGCAIFRPGEVAFGAQACCKNMKALPVAGRCGTITVNQLPLIALPGESTLAGLFGIVSQGSTGGLRFEGSVETAGKSLASGTDDSGRLGGYGLPETGSGDFSIRSNIFVSSEQIAVVGGGRQDQRPASQRRHGGVFRRQ